MTLCKNVSMWISAGVSPKAHISKCQTAPLHEDELAFLGFLFCPIHLSTEEFKLHLLNPQAQKGILHELGLRFVRETPETAIVKTYIELSFGLSKCFTLNVAHWETLPLWQGSSINPLN